MAGETAELKAKLDDGSHIHLVWLQNGALAVQRFTSGTWSDGHGFMLTGSGIVEAEAMRAFLAAAHAPQQKKGDLYGSSQRTST